MKSNKNTNKNYSKSDNTNRFFNDMFNKEHKEAVEFRKGKKDKKDKNKKTDNKKNSRKVKPIVVKSLINPDVLNYVDNYLDSVDGKIDFVDFGYLTTSGIIFDSSKAFKACMRYIGFWIMVGLTSCAIWNTLNYFLDGLK